MPRATSFQWGTKRRGKPWPSSGVHIKDGWKFLILVLIPCIPFPWTGLLHIGSRIQYHFEAIPNIPLGEQCRYLTTYVYSYINRTKHVKSARTPHASSFGDNDKGSESSINSCWRNILKPQMSHVAFQTENISKMHPWR